MSDATQMNDTDEMGKTPAFSRDEKAGEVEFRLSLGQAAAMNTCFDVTSWKADVPYKWGVAELGRIEKKIAELTPKERWPGTKLFDHEAAYRIELLRRVVTRLRGDLGGSV